MFDSIHTLITSKGWNPALFNALIFIGATILIQVLYAWHSRKNDKDAAGYSPTTASSPTDFTRLIEQHAPGRFTRQQLREIEQGLQHFNHHPEANLSIKQFDLGSVDINTHSRQENPAMPSGSHIMINGGSIDVHGVKIELHTESDRTQLVINGQTVDLTPYTRNHR